MALQKTLVKKEQNFSGELVAQNAYWRVESVSADKTKGTAKVLTYTEKPSEKSAIVSSMLIDFPVDLNGENFIKQAYNHIKTMPEFSGAVDC